MKRVGNPCSKQNPKQCDNWLQRRSNDLSQIARKQPQDAVQTRNHPKKNGSSWKRVCDAS